MTVLYMHINEPPPPIQGIHPALQNVIQRVLAKKPEDRYQTARELSIDFGKAIEQSAQSETIGKPFVPPPESTPPSEPAMERGKPRKARNWKRILTIAVGALALCICGPIVIGMLSDGQPTAPDVTEPPITKPTVVSFINTLFPTDEATKVPILPTPDGNSAGIMRFQNGTAIADTLTISTMTMSPPPKGSRYEAWLIQDDGEQRTSIGILRFGLENKGSLIYVDEKGQNLLGKYSALEITLEPDPDDNPNPSGTLAFAVRLPAGGLAHVRHLLSSFGTTPSQIGFIQGLDEDTNLLSEAAEQMLAAVDDGDDDLILLQAEKMLNLIVGDQSKDFKDWDGNGKIDNLGDGYGLLLNGDHLGYIQGTFTHAGLSITSPDATPNMITHGDHVKICANNVNDWTAQLSTLLMNILKDPNGPAERSVRQAVALANQIRTGLDANGNEQIEPIPGECGARTAQEHAYYMADMLIPAPVNQTPAP